ncbi:1278_t:CDS:1, partial [Racocetra persica]
ENGEMLGNLETTGENVVDIDSVASGYHSEASYISDCQATDSPFRQCHYHTLYHL